MVRLDIHAPEDLYTLRLYVWSGRCDEKCVARFILEPAVDRSSQLCRSKQADRHGELGRALQSVPIRRGCDQSRRTTSGRNGTR